MPGGETTRLTRPRLEQDYADWLSFSFVRNPCARLVSTFCQKIHAEPFTADNVIDGVHPGLVEMGLPLYAGMTVEDFVEVVCGLDDGATEKHLKSQTAHLYRDGRCLVTYVGRLESMAEDWRRVSAMAGLRHPLPHLNRSRHGDYTTYYRVPLLTRMVTERYQSDFANFVYDPGRL